MNLQGKRAAIVTLGCKVNQYETDAMYGMLKEVLKNVGTKGL